MFLSLNAYGQKQTVGFLGGYNVSRLVNFRIDNDYTFQHYNFKSGFSVASFYETSNLSNIGMRVGLQYSFQNADLEIEYHQGHTSYYKNIDYTFHKLDLQFDLVFSILKEEKLKINFVVGPEIDFMVKTISRGYGWDHYSSGLSGMKDWEVVNRNSKDFSVINLGVGLGIEFLIPFNNRLEFLIQHKNVLMVPFHQKLLSACIRFGCRLNLQK